MMRKSFLALLTQLDRSGSACPGHTRVFALTLLRMLSPQDRYDTLQFLNEYCDPKPAPKPRLQVIAGGLT
jgi:hypothetical protein